MDDQTANRESGGGVRIHFSLRSLLMLMTIIAAFLMGLRIAYVNGYDSGIHEGMKWDPPSPIK
jgi:hypothetical protein